MIRVTIDGVIYATDDERKLREWVAAGKPGAENMIWRGQICFGNQFPADGREKP